MAAAIALLVGGAALTILLFGIRSSMKSTAITANDMSQWSLDSRVWVDSRIANGITVYADYTAAEVEPWKRLTVDGRGDFLVLSLSESQPVTGRLSYLKLTGYYFDRPTNSILRFDHEVSALERTTFVALEDILKNNMNAIKASAQVQTSGATSVGTNGIFTCRAAGKAASLACVVAIGDRRNRTFESKMIEATFIIRN